MDIEKRRANQRKAQAKFQASHIEYYRERRKQQRARDYTWYHDLKSKLKCFQCPESHIACLHFHHVDRATKKSTIADMVRKGFSILKIEEEISKCIVLCANCHAKLHWAENPNNELLA